MADMRLVAKSILEKLRENGQGTEQGQLYCLAEETGEFIGAMRRWRGMARRSGTVEDAQSELADVVITAFIMAEVLDWDIQEIVDRKLTKIFTRGWKDQ